MSTTGTGALAGCASGGPDGPGWGSGSGSNGSGGNGGNDGGGGTQDDGGGGGGGDDAGGNGGGDDSGGGGGNDAGGGGSIDPSFQCQVGGNGYLTADELCAYGNWARTASPTEYWGAQKYYCPNVPYSATFTIDSALSAAAQKESDRLAAGGQPVGNPECDYGPCNPVQFWVDGERAYSVNDQYPTDWGGVVMTWATEDTPGSCNFNLGNSSWRGEWVEIWACTPPLPHNIGCGETVTPDGKKIWRVIKMGP
jgi:hypothetical protein